MPEGTRFFAPIRLIVEEIRVSCLRLAKYSQSPLGYFLGLSLTDLCGWIAVVNREIEAEEEACKKQISLSGMIGFFLYWKVRVSVSGQGEDRCGWDR